MRKRCDPVSATIGPVDRIFSRIGAADDLAGGVEAHHPDVLVGAAQGHQQVQLAVGGPDDLGIEAKGLGFVGKGCIHPRQITVVHDAFAPGEDEIALSLLTPDSTYLAWSFPLNREYYNSCLTLKGLDSRRLQAWRR